MIKKLLLLLVLLMTAATGSWAASYRLYLDVSGTSATLKYGSYDGKPSYSSGKWYDFGDVKTTVQTITTDATSCASFSGTTLKSLFEQFTALTSVDLSGLNTANVTNMAYMFNSCSSLTSFNLSGLNTDKVTAMNDLFNGCTSLTSVDLSGLNTANVTDMTALIGGCTSLTSVDLSGLNTSKVTKMASMFNSCSSLTSVDLSSWDTSSATSMGSMFSGCSALTSVNLSSWDTSSATSMGSMFNRCSSLATLDLSSFNTSKVTSMISMFSGCTNLATIYVGNDWSTAAVTFSADMFAFCTKLLNLNSNHATDKTNAHTGEGGYLKVKAKTYKVTLQEGTEDAEKWTIDPAEAAEGTTVTATYNGTRKVKSVKAVKKGGVTLATPMTIEAITAGTIIVTSPKDGMQYSLNGGAKTAVSGDINVAAGDKVAFYGKGTSITSYNGTKISGGTAEVKVYGNIMSLVDETGFATATTLSAEYTFSSLFRNNAKLIDASGLLQPAKNLASYCYAGMFNGCSSLTAAPELSATGLAEACYQLMFNACSSLTTAPELKATTLVDDCYNSMFAYCSSLTATPKLPATTLVNRCYQDMFFNCTNLTVAYVKAAYDSSYNISSMFYGCTDASTSTFYSDDAASWTSAFFKLTNWQKASYPTE